MFFAAKRKNIWQLRRQNFHTRRITIPPAMQAINMAQNFSIVFFFLIIYVSTTNVYMYYLLLVLLKIRDIFLT